MIPKERDIERTCTEMLALDGWRCLKTDPVSRREWGKGFGENGMADCLYIRYCAATNIKLIDKTAYDLLVCTETLWIEWKRVRPGLKSATKAHQNQNDWHRDERARGAMTLIAGVDFPATIEGFMEWYTQSGLMRRRLSAGHQVSRAEANKGE